MTQVYNPSDELCKVVFADKTHPFFNCQDVQASTHIFEYNQLDFWLFEYVVRHRFLVDNHSLRSAAQTRNLFMGKKMSQHKVSEIDIDFVGVEEKKSREHSIRLCIRNTAGDMFPVVEELRYSGTSTDDLVLRDHKRYRNFWVIHEQQPSQETRQEIAARGRTQFERILAAVAKDYPGKDPLERGKQHLIDFYSDDFRFYPQ
jgi:hypothetical protein